MSSRRSRTRCSRARSPPTAMPAASRSPYDGCRSSYTVSESVVVQEHRRCPSPRPRGTSPRSSKPRRRPHKHRTMKLSKVQTSPCTIRHRHRRRASTASRRCLPPHAARDDRRLGARGRLRSSERGPAPRERPARQSRRPRVAADRIDVVGHAELASADSSSRSSRTKIIGRHSRSPTTARTTSPAASRTS